MSLSLSVVSDVHLEMRTGKEIDAVINSLVAPKQALPTVLAVVGDVSPNPNTRLRFFTSVSTTFDHILFVPGNHDYWNDWKGMAYTDTVRFPELEQSIPNCHVLVKKTFCLGNVVFAGAPLWSDPDPVCSSLIMDYQKIRVNAYQGYSSASPYIKVPMVKALHADQRAWFAETLTQPQDPNTKRVGLSHHVPTWSLCPDRERDDPVATAYYSHCDDLVAMTDLWVHGHTHQACFDGKVVSNPLGYPRQATGYQADRVWVL